MNTLTIKLKQHTPLIHFQHNQDGATLRASEVKPKLDKYIIKNVFHDNFEECKNFLVGYNPMKPNDQKEKFEKGYKALDYKMRIEAEGLPEEYLIASLLPRKKIISKSDIPFKMLQSTPFFAQENVNSSSKSQDYPVFLRKKDNNGQSVYIYDEDNWSKIGKKGLKWKNVKITFFSLNENLLKYIDLHISSFLICTNFGTRSNKGFGSFTKVDCEDKFVQDALKTNFKFVYKKEKKIIDLNDTFKTVKEDYQKIKSGVNHYDYTKSILFCYAIKKMEGSPRWEKRFFKKAVKDRLGSNYRLLDKNHQPILDCKGNCSWTDNSKYDYRYVRALLGLAEQYEFQLESLTDGKWKPNYKSKLVVKPKITGIDRCESPILFKIINGVIYVVGNDINTRLLNKEVKIDYLIDKEKIPVSKDNKIIQTPKYFDLADFMQFAMSESFKLGYKKVK